MTNLPIKLTSKRPSNKTFIYPKNCGTAPQKSIFSRIIHLLIANVTPHCIQFISTRLLSETCASRRPLTTAEMRIFSRPNENIHDWSASSNLPAYRIAAWGPYGRRLSKWIIEQLSKCKNDRRTEWQTGDAPNVRRTNGLIFELKSYFLVLRFSTVSVLLCRKKLFKTDD